MVTLYDRDAADVRALLVAVADIFKRDDPDGKGSGPLLYWRNSLATIQSAAVAADPNKQGILAADRLTSIVAAIDDQLRLASPERE